jgi:hypothetical protein
MKFHFLFIALTVIALAGKAQMGGGYNGTMSPQMQNMPQGNTGPDKPDEPPHGGEVKEAGKYNIEVVFDPFSTEEKLNVWLLKSNFKPAKTDKATAKVTIKYPKLDGKEETKDLILSDDRFYCNVAEPSATFTAFITITVKGKEYKMVFNQKGMEGK